MPAGTVTVLAPKWRLSASTTGSPDIGFVACFELPRPDLAADSSDKGVRLDTLNENAVIYSGTGIGIEGVSKALVEAETRSCRAGIFQWARDTTNALSTTAGAWTPVFLSGAVPVCLGRKLYRNDTVRTLQVRAYCRSGAATTGDVRFTMTSGDTLTLSITAGMAGTWLTGELDVESARTAGDAPLPSRG